MDLRFSTSLVALTSLACAGCLSFETTRPEVRAWTISPMTVPVAAVAITPDAKPAGTTRLGAITVLAPYDHVNFTVKRADGSLAADPCNLFASTPAALLRLPALAALGGDRRFGHVVNQTSIASADAAVEMLVTELALDCSREGQRTARVALTLDVIRSSSGGKREVSLTGSGTGEANASSGDYSAAFTEAANAALRGAMANLR